MENAQYKILLVDDEPDIIEFLTYNLEKEGFQVLSCSNGLKGVEMAMEHRPHLILLDVMMPEMDGIETCEAIRRHDEMRNTIVAFLTARGEDYSQIAGFEAGADDYITKPIKPKLLVSRINALLKRYNDSSASASSTLVYTIGELTIDHEKYMVMIGQTEISLPKKEFELLNLLAGKPDKVFLRDEIYSMVWGDSVIVGDRTIDVHIRKLREKIGEHHIKTVKGVGYKFVV